MSQTFAVFLAATTPTPRLLSQPRWQTETVKGSVVFISGSSTQGGRLFGGPWMYLRPNTSKYLEILISVCLYFIRSHYPSHLLIQPADNTGNLEVCATGLRNLIRYVPSLACGISLFCKG